MRGGCTALVALFLLGRLYVANAGDSRAVVCRRGRSLVASHDFTPETERQRVRQLVSNGVSWSVVKGALNARVIVPPGTI